jgi:hypothetical protein
MQTPYTAFGNPVTGVVALDPLKTDSIYQGVPTT